MASHAPLYSAGAQSSHKRMRGSQSSSLLGNTPLSSGLLASWSTTQGEGKEDILANLSWSTQGEGMEDILPQLLRLGREDGEDDYSLLENSSFGRDKAIPSGGESNFRYSIMQGGRQLYTWQHLGGGEIVFRSVAQRHTLAPCMLANYYQPPFSQVTNGHKSAADSLANQQSSASRRRWVH